MPNLTVALVKISNLRDDSPGVDVADPYVQFELMQQQHKGGRILHRANKDSMGKMESSRKKNERNPVYNETFVFEDVPTLDNLELHIKVMDEDDKNNQRRDDKLGGCSIALEKLNLEPFPQLVRRKVDNNVFGKDAYIFLNMSYGEKAVDTDAVGLSHVGQAAYDCLRSLHSEYHHWCWNVTRGKVVGELHQTPKHAFPGPPGNYEDGHDDWFPEIMGDILSRTEAWADVLSLGPPDGKFMTAFQNALLKIAENAAGKAEPVIIRMMFGNIVGMPVDCNKVSRELVGKLSADANVRLWVGAWRRGVSWNHAKIIAVDGKYLHTGGHNMWDGHYLSFNPVHDLSLEMAGDVAMDGHIFANWQWDFISSRQESFWGTIGSRMPDSMPQAAKVRVIVSEWPRGVASEHPPKFTNGKVASVEADSYNKALEETVPIITMGRYGCLLPKDRPSDDAFLAMLGSAQKVIHLALQDLGPVCIPGTKISLPGCVWPDDYLNVLAKVLWEKGVDIEIVVSNPGSIPGGLRPTEANYGNGWSCVDVAAEIIKRIKTKFPDAEDGQLRKKIVENLRIAFIREERGNTWKDGMNMGMHAKHFIVDDIATYIGSQNLYICDLAEWGVVIDDEEQTKKFMAEYWDPLWKYSYTGEDVDVDAVMDGLDVNRDGADATNLDEETKEKMKQAELANAGIAQNALYEEEEC